MEIGCQKSNHIHWVTQNQESYNDIGGVKCQLLLITRNKEQKSTRLDTI